MCKVAGVEPVFNFLFLVAGGLISVLFVFLLGFRRFTLRELSLGFAALLISVLVQQPIQQLPVLTSSELMSRILSGDLTLGEALSVIESFAVNQDPLYIIALSLWLGFVAGTVQTIIKYLFACRNGNYIAAVNIGLGFGVAESILLGFSALLSSFLFSGSPAGVDIPLYMYMVATYERFSAALFHVGSTLFLVDMSANNRKWTGLLAVILIHGTLDSGAAFYNFTENPIVLVAVEIGLLLAALLLTLKLVKKALATPK